jgi:ligand-binding sensor domain-containing protein
MRLSLLLVVAFLLLPVDGSGEWEVHVNSNVVTDVWADAINVYWGSGFGVVIYDPSSGTHAKLFKSAGGLVSSDVTAITKDRAGRLWVGTADGGLSVLGSDGTWHSHNTSNFHLLSNAVRDVAVHSESLSDGWNSLAVVGTSEGVSLFENGLFRTFFDATDWSGSGCNLSEAVAADAERILVGTECGCYSYSFASKTWDVVVPGQHTTSIDYDGEGTFWIVTADSIYTYDGSELEVISKQFIRPDLIYDIAAVDSAVWIAGSNGPAWYDFPTESWIHVTEGLVRDLWDARSVFVTDQGTVWLGTEAGGAVLAEGAWVIYASDGPAGNYVQDIEIDRDGRVWCATGTRSSIPGDVNLGIIRYDGFEWDLIGRDPLVSGRAYCLDASPVDGSMFVGFWGGGLMMYDGNSTTWDTLNTGLSSLVISEVYVDPLGRLFIGEYLTGLAVLCPDDMLVHYSSEDDPVCVETKCITAIGPGPVGAMVGSYLVPAQGCLDRVLELDIGAECADKADDECRIWSSIQGYAGGNAYDFETDIYGVAWLASSGGLSSFDGKWRTVNTTLGDVWDIEVDSYGTKWVAAGEGLYALKGYGTTWEHFSESVEKYDSSNSPLDDSPIKALAFDADGALWVGTGGGGIFRFTGPRSRTRKQWVDVFPNPYYSWEDDEGKGIRFTGFAPARPIRIYTVAGDLVAEIDPDGPWYGRNADGEEVVSGVYIYHAYTGEGREFVGRFVIVR